MIGSHQQRDQSYMAAMEASTKEIIIPDGFELALYTLKRVSDGRLQSYLPVNASATPVQAIPISVHPPDVEVGLDSTLFPPTPSPNHSSYHVQTPNQQLYNIPAYQGHGNLANTDDRAQTLSAKTQKRHAHSRDDDYTDVYGVFSQAKAIPVKKYNYGNGKFYCPRCGSNFTRPKSVKDHFPDCVSKCGNPQALCFTDHPSMAQTEAVIQRRSRASREASNVNMEGNDTEAEGKVQGIKFEEMNDALARATIHGVHGGVSTDDGTYIKTEFVFGADIAYESTETSFPENQSHSINLDAHRTSLHPSSFSSKAYIAGTPEWQAGQGTSPRLGSSTPTAPRNPWNIGIPGSAAEHAIMDMRFTAPFEGWSSEVKEWPSEAQTPKRTNGDGLQDDGLDNFMDRRSYFSPTPAACYPSSRMEDLGEECEMEE